MRVLFLTCHLPFPPVSGGRLREHELLKRLAADVDVHVCAVTKTFAEDVRAAPLVGRICHGATVFRAAGGQACSNGSQPAQVASHASSEGSTYIGGVLRGDWFDLVHVEGFYLAQHVPRHVPVPVLLVEQNVEFELWRQRMETAREERERRRFFLQYRLTREAELRAWRRATALATVTADDRATVHRVASGLEVDVVPDGIDHLKLVERLSEADDKSVVMTGNFAYQPTADAAVWFCAEILPALEARVPAVRVTLAGTDPPPEVRALARSNVTVTGRVPRIEPYLDRAAVVVCPLRIGGGIKVKILEALARGKPIVTTSIGVQGLGEDGADAVRIADEPEQFAAAVADLLERPRERRACARAARAFAATLPTWDDAAAALLARYRALVADSREVVSGLTPRR
jgi:glycosyltransferase involved in cell wall biosynthesis